MTKQELSDFCSQSLERLDIITGNIVEVCPTGKTALTDIEQAAASALFHYFYTHVEDILRHILIFDGIAEPSNEPNNQQGHQRLLKTAGELGIVPPDLFKPLSDLLAFRSAFLLGRTESIPWSEISPLASLLPEFRDSFRREVSEYLAVVEIE